MSKIFKIICIGFIMLIASFNTASAHPMAKAEFAKMFEEYLLSNPEIVELALIQNQQKKQNEKDNKISNFIQDNKASIENPEGLFIGGNLNGDITLVEFFDYNCTYCKQSFDGINLLLETDKNLKLVMYELPILAQSSLTAARASLAAKVQGKYWDFHAAVISHQGTLTDEMIFAYAVQVGLDVDQLKQDMVSETTEKALIASANLAESLEVNGTPAFIIDGQLFPGAIGYENMLAVIADSRAKKTAQTGTN